MSELWYGRLEQIFTYIFTAEVFLDRTPLTASNFIDLAQSGFYNGLHFHRVSGPPPSPLLSLLQR